MMKFRRNAVRTPRHPPQRGFVQPSKRRPRERDNRRMVSAFERAYREIKGRILAFRLKPLDALNEADLARILDMSRTPIREALRKLEREGLVWFAPHKGTFVTPISLEDILEIYILREALEGTAAALAAKRGTRDEIESVIRLVESVTLDGTQPDLERMSEVDSKVHEAVLKWAGLPKLKAIVSQLNEQAIRMRFIGVAARPRGSKDDLLALLESIKNKDSTRAESLMRAHIGAAKETLASIGGKSEMGLK